MTLLKSGIAIVRDITPADGIPKLEKSRREREALESMCELLGGGPRAKEISDLWMKYENNSSLEAKVVKDFDKLIYFGDHLFSDRRGPSKSRWRTAASIHELEAKFHIIQELLGKLHATVAKSGKSEAYAFILEELNEERQKVRNIMKVMFNNSFGATFLTDTGFFKLVENLIPCHSTRLCENKTKISPTLPSNLW